MSYITLWAHNTPTGSKHITVTIPRSHAALVRKTNIRKNVSGLLVNRSSISVGGSGKSAGLHTLELNCRAINPFLGAELVYFLSNYSGLYTYLDDYYEMKRYAGIFIDWGFEEGGKKTGRLPNYDSTYNGDSFLMTDDSSDYVIKPHVRYIEGYHYICLDDVCVNRLDPEFTHVPIDMQIITYTFRATFVSETIETLET